MRRIRKTIYSVAVLCGVLWGCAGTYSSALASDEKPLTLKMALELSEERNLDILSAREELVRAKGKIVEADAEGLPTFNAGASYTRREAGKEDILEEDVYSAGVTLTQPLYKGGQIRAGKRQASYGLLQAENFYKETREQIALDVYNRFYAVLLEKENVATAEDALAFAEKYLEEVKKKRVLGLATGLEITRAEKQLAENRSALIRATNNLKTAHLDLFELLNLAPDASYMIQGKIAYVPIDGGDPALSLAKALELRPELLRAKNLVKEREQSVEIAKSGLRPSVSVSGSYRYDDPNQTGYDKKDTWLARLNVDIPIIDSGATHGRVVQQTALLEQAKRGVEKKEEAIRTEVQSVYLDLDTAAQVLKEAKVNLDLAKETLRLAEVGYREGVGIQLDVLNARASLTQAMQEHSAALRNYAYTIVRLKKAEGNLVDEPVLSSIEE
ncbi:MULTISPECIES: TolC family protein [Aminobacterium]|jgi:outer membrane protein TolC|uniref:TolC family protein n=1 Tax=Aminobacterium TaxID=81466 RepID=UPI00257B2BFE|nr:TolC family protein [Aminobacterium sp. UBA4834]